MKFIPEQQCRPSHQLDLDNFYVHIFPICNGTLLFKARLYERVRHKGETINIKQVHVHSEHTSQHAT